MKNIFFSKLKIVVQNLFCCNSSYIAHLNGLLLVFDRADILILTTTFFTETIYILLLTIEIIVRLFETKLFVHLMLTKYCLMMLY